MPVDWRLYASDLEQHRESLLRSVHMYNGLFYSDVVNTRMLIHNQEAHFLLSEISQPHHYVSLQEPMMTLLLGRANRRGAYFPSYSGQR